MTAERRGLGGRALQRADAFRWESADAAQAWSASWAAVRRLTTARLTVGLWSIAAFLDLTSSFLGGGTPATFARVAVTYSCGAGLALVAHRLATSTRELRSFSFIRVLATAIPVGTLLFLVDVLGRAVAHGHAPWRSWPSDFFLRLRPLWAYFMTLFVFQSTAAWLASAARELERHERRLVQSRLETLRLQISPHFLFNTLNTVALLINEADATRAELMIERLSAFLRTSLSVEPSPLVPLSAEIDMAQAYLDIEAARSDRLMIRYDIESGLDEALVPSLILQPLIENAVKHGLGPSAHPVLIAISARCSDGQLLLAVENDGPTPRRPAAKGLGIGQANIEARLRALYGGKAQLRTLPLPSGYRADIQIPLAMGCDD